MVISLMLTSLCTEYYQFFLCQGVLGGVLTGLTYTPAITVVGQYFQRKRSAPMCIAAAGSSLGGIIYPVVLNQLLKFSNVGFAWAQPIIAFIILP
jgi:MFS family permease